MTETTAKFPDIIGFEDDHCPPHELCEPGCWEEFRGPKGETWFPHCWKCGARMEYTPALADTQLGEAKP